MNSSVPCPVLRLARAASNVFFASLIAIVLFDERLTALHLVGVVLIVAGHGLWSQRPLLIATGLCALALALAAVLARRDGRESGRTAAAAFAALVAASWMVTPMLWAEGPGIGQRNVTLAWLGLTVSGVLATTLALREGQPVRRRLQRSGVASW
jgi:drug/metabolite transporter (DMT)-like permease